MEDLITPDAEEQANPKLIGFSENDVQVRPFKLLRTRLSKYLGESGEQVIGITSASPHAGKSFIVSNLAASMSRIARDKVVLVDLDFQRASVAELFGITDQPGIADFLLGEEEAVVPNIARPYKDTGLTIAPAFIRRVNSAELLASERFAAFMGQLRELPNRPTILCDLPPLFVSDDAIIAAQHLDAVIIVVEQGVTTKKQLTASLEMLYPTKVLGTVFNRFHGGFIDSYGYYGNYGDYYN